MNAKEARQLAELYLHPDIDTLVADIDRRIEEAAKHGKTQIIDPDLGHLNDGVHVQLTREQRRSLRKHYESRGFTWRDSPKAGHPCCRGLTSIAW